MKINWVATGAGAFFSVTSFQMMGVGSSREVLAYSANSYFDALEGDDVKIAAFADDCARHENGYQTVNNPPPGGRMMPAPPLPNPDTPQGKDHDLLSFCP